MAGGGGGVQGLRLNVMTALYLPILLYAMSTYDLEGSSLVLTQDSLVPHAVPSQSSLATGEEFEAPIYYEILPIQQQGARQMGGVEEEGGGDEAAESAKGAFDPDVTIDEENSPEGMYYDEAEQVIRFNTADVFAGEPSSLHTKELSYRAMVTGKTLEGDEFSSELEGTFSVFRPVINVQSNVPPQLFADSRNSLSFNVQGVDAQSLRLRDESTGHSASGSTIEWTPSGDTTVVEVAYEAPDGELRTLGEEGFRVRTPPPPTVGIREVGEQDFLAGGSTLSPRTDFELVVRPDDTYLTGFPDDARYTVGSLRLRLTRTGVAPEEVEISAAQLESMYDEGRSAALNEDVYRITPRRLFNDPRGNNMQIIIRDLERINYEGRSFTVDTDLFQDSFTFEAN